MLDVLKVASYISRRYMSEYGERIDEMKLHKLLYFTQRECLIQTSEPMFTAKFEAWKYGPVMLDIRQLYKEDALHYELEAAEIERYKRVFDKVFLQYAPKSSWSLSTLSHGEYSWKKARAGISRYDSCDVEMDVDDIRKDADRMRVRRFLLAKYKDFQMARV